MRLSSTHRAGAEEEEKLTMSTTKKLALKDYRGQGMTEYIIIVALIAIAAIGVITTFGDDIRNIFTASTEALAGSPTASSKTKAYKATQATPTLENFGADAKGQ